LDATKASVSAALLYKTSCHIRRRAGEDTKNRWRDFRIQQKLNELPPAEEAAALKNKIAELEKQRAEILDEMEKAARGRIK
jgi:hypothetical protein